MKCRLLSIKCHRSSESGGDEVYLKFNGSKIWPVKESWAHMTSDSEVRIDVQVPTDGTQNEVVVDIFDQDSLLDDKLGSFKLNLGGTTGSFTTDMSSSREGASYTLGWESYR